MEAVSELEEWQEVIERNPPNKQRLLQQDRDEFLKTFDRWIKVNLSREGDIVPGLPKEEAAQIRHPALVVLSHALDWIHLRWVSEELAAALPNSTTADWPEAEARQMALDMTTVGASALFPRWPLLVPTLDRWATESVL
jgi:hypothetical protein